MADVPFEHIEGRAPQLRQLLSQLEVAKQHGQTDLVEAAEKQLRQLGHDPAKRSPKVARDEAPAERRAQHERAEKADTEAGGEGAAHDATVSSSSKSPRRRSTA